MKRMCREIVPTWRRRRSWEILRHARVVTDPKELAQLKVEAEKAKLLSFRLPFTYRNR
jgi:hypothetical protein